jgi:hypothetical protein
MRPAAIAILALLGLTPSTVLANPEPEPPPPALSSEITGGVYTTTIEFFWGWESGRPNQSQLDSLKAYRRQVSWDPSSEICTNWCEKNFMESSSCESFLSDVDESVPNLTIEVCSRTFGEEYYGICGRAECAPSGFWRYEFQIGGSSLTRVIEKHADEVPEGGVPEQCVTGERLDDVTQQPELATEPTGETLPDAASVSDISPRGASGCSTHFVGVTSGALGGMALVLAGIGLWARRRRLRTATRHR